MCVFIYTHMSINSIIISYSFISNIWWDQFTNGLVMVAKLAERNLALNIFNK